MANFFDSVFTPWDSIEGFTVFKFFIQVLELKKKYYL